PSATRSPRSSAGPRRTSTASCTRFATSPRTTASRSHATTVRRSASGGRRRRSGTASSRSPGSRSKRCMAGSTGGRSTTSRSSSSTSPASSGRRLARAHEAEMPALPASPQQALSVYDPISWLYDPWSASVIEDVSFYVDEALTAGGEVVELGVGTGRIAIPTALAGAHVIGVDSSRGMLAVCAERAREAGIAERLDLRLGDLRRPPVDERVPLVTCPFRSYLHLRDDAEVLDCYGWFDRRPFAGGEDSIWIARRK